MTGAAGTPVPLRVIRAVAPIRICDIGGWTDTWFAGHGKVFNMAVSPNVEVRVSLYRREMIEHRVVLDVQNYGDRYGFDPGGAPGRHPLLEAAVEEIGVPDRTSVDISISSEAPPGSSTGTSAATLVALVGTLIALTPGRITPHRVAQAAHHIEVGRLGRQSGVQDQICAAYGGINFIEIATYPRAVVSPLSTTPDFRRELQRRLSLLYLGRSHESSTIHDRVIARASYDDEISTHLEALRRAAERARDAVLVADLTALGSAMKENTEAQGNLHADLISDDAKRVIEMAAAHGAVGWKVNGAGGAGGSLTLLSGPDMRSQQDMLRVLSDADPRFQLIACYLSPAGLRMWQT